jgi:hypothetical protein
MTSQEDKVNLEINDANEALLEISKEFIRTSIPKIKDLLMELITDKGIKTIKINIKEPEPPRIKFTQKDIPAIRHYIEELEADNHQHIAQILRQELRRLEEEHYFYTHSIKKQSKSFDDAPDKEENKK